MKRISVLFIAALMVLAHGRATAQTDRNPMVLNAILSLTGIAAFIGGDEQNGLRAFEEAVNKSGGLRGQPIHFQFYDDQSLPVVAVQLLNQVLNTHPTVVFGSSLTPQTQAMATLVEKSGPVLYAETNNLVAPNGGYVYTAGPNNTLQQLAAIRYYKARHLTKFAMLTTNDVSGQNGILSLQTALKDPSASGCTLVDIERFSAGDLSTSAQVAKIKASGAQVIFALANGTAFGTSLHAISDSGLAGVPVYTSAGNFTPSFLRDLQSVLPEELNAAAPSFLNQDRPASDQLKAPIDRFYNALAAIGVQNPNTAHAFGWDSALIVFSALQKLGPNATADQLRASIDSLKHFAGAMGFYDFTTGDRHGLGVDSELVFKNDKSNPGRTIVVSRQGGLPL